MKIVSWNCNGKFRTKFNIINKLDADIYIIQECEDPTSVVNENFKKFCTNYKWIGNNKNKGLGVFAKDSIKLEELNWDKLCLRYFLPLRVNDQFDLLAVWAMNPYIEEFYIYQQLNKKSYTDDLIIFGDFNSNKKFDNKSSLRKERGHMKTVQELQSYGLEDAYHYTTKEEQGKETKNTFYLYRHNDKGYHIDHCFINPVNLCDFIILDDPLWLEFSDHMPCVLINNTNK